MREREITLSQLIHHTYHSQVLSCSRLDRSEELSEPPHSSGQVPVCTQNLTRFPSGVY